MDKNERIISDYIDVLGAERKPEGPADSPEMEKLMETVRTIRTLKEPVLPGKGFPVKLAAKIYREKRGARYRARWIAGISATAAITAVLLIILSLPFAGGNVVYAMQKAYGELKAYHGILAITETNGLGQTSTQEKLEVWADKQGRYYVQELEGTQKGLVTANNGQKKWQINTDAHEVAVYPAFPDSYRFALDLGSEVQNVGNALDTKKIGEEEVSGRVCTVLQVTPKGGEPYRIWVDKDTSLPIQKQTDTQNGMPYQYTASYTSIDFLDAIPAEKLAYSIPSGYKEVDTAREQWVNTPGEAQNIAGFLPAMPKETPAGFAQSGIAVQAATKTTEQFYESQDKTKKVVLLQKKAEDDFKPDPNAILGRIGSAVAEIQPVVQDWQGILAVGPYAGATGISSIRWQADGFEFAVAGNIPPDAIAPFAEAVSGQKLEMPSPSPEASGYQVEVPVDMTAEQNSQKSVDEGHSPWRLDPAFVAQVFVSLKISPGGIEGDYPIPYEDFKVTQNSGSDTVVQVNSSKTPIAKVYLKRLVRQDETGIWTVVGYDPAAKQ